MARSAGNGYAKGVEVRAQRQFFGWAGVFLNRCFLPAIRELTDGLRALDIFSVKKYSKGMFYFYILQCADDKRYYGQTDNLRQRLSRHQDGMSKATKARRPVKLVYYEKLESRSAAIARERKFKNGKTRKATIDKLIASFPAERLSEFL